MTPLTEEDLAILDFEDRWWRRAGAKDAAIRASFDTTTVRHYQRLSALIDRAEALAARPVVVARLRRIRDRRRRAIAAR